MGRRTHFILVEDDHLQRSAIEDLVLEIVPDVAFFRYDTAVEALEAIEAGRWDGVSRAVILDRMLKWCDLDHPRINSPAPVGVERGDAVLNAIALRPSLADVPVATLSIKKGPPEPRRARTSALGKSASLDELREWITGLDRSGW